MTQLQVLISTIGAAGIKRVADAAHPAVEGVEYLVAWQQPDGDLPLPEELRRPDFRFAITRNRGLSRNRNTAIDAATAPLCLIADDDVRYTPEALSALIDAFANTPEADILLLRHAGISAQAKNYPPGRCRMQDAPAGYYATSFEIAFRRRAVQGILRFNEHMGIGAPELPCGEEDVFLADARAKGLSIFLEPLEICTHNHPSSAITLGNSRPALMAKGAVFLRIHPRLWLPALMRNALRERRKSGFSPLLYMRYALAGVRYARKNKIFNHAVEEK